MIDDITKIDDNQNSKRQNQNSYPLIIGKRANRFECKITNGTAYHCPDEPVNTGIESLFTCLFHAYYRGDASTKDVFMIEKHGYKCANSYGDGCF